MIQITNVELSIVSGGKNCLVDFRVAHGITDPNVVCPAVMVPVDHQGKPLPIETFRLEDLINIK
ncbi:MAG TPA: hypothetical protein VFP93_03195 [Gammaproteobacteria bacterium]|nr:hypothetical protein [Gammaproteobacteria bacterium]